MANVKERLDGNFWQMVISILLTIILALGGFGFKAMLSRMDKIEESIGKQTNAVAALATAVAVNASKIDANKEAITEVKNNKKSGG